MTGVIIIGVSGCLSPWKGYDADSDILTIGEPAADPGLITDNGDFVAHRQADETDPGACRDPIGVSIRSASKHLVLAIAILTDGG